MGASVTDSNRRVRTPYARWCGRGRRATAAPMPINNRLEPTRRAVLCAHEIEARGSSGNVRQLEVPIGLATNHKNLGAGVESKRDLRMESEEGLGKSQEAQGLVRRGHHRVHRPVRAHVRRSGSFLGRATVHHNRHVKPATHPVLVTRRPQCGSCSDHPHAAGHKD